MDKKLICPPTICEGLPYPEVKRQDVDFWVEIFGYYDTPVPPKGLTTDEKPTWYEMYTYTFGDISDMHDLIRSRRTMKKLKPGRLEQIYNIKKLRELPYENFLSVIWKQDECPNCWTGNCNYANQDCIYISLWGIQHPGNPMRCEIYGCKGCENCQSSPQQEG